MCFCGWIIFFCNLRSMSLFYCILCHKPATPIPFRERVASTAKRCRRIRKRYNIATRFKTKIPRGYPRGILHFMTFYDDVMCVGLLDIFEKPHGATGIFSTFLRANFDRTSHINVFKTEAPCLICIGIACRPILCHNTTMDGLG